LNREAEEVLTLVAERANLSEGMEGVRSVLLYMYRFPSLKNKILAQKTGIAIPAMAAVRGELKKAGILESRNFLGSKGREWVKKNLHLHFDYDPLPKSLRIESIKEFEYVENYLGILNERPDPKFNLDQAHATPKTVLKRVSYLLEKGDIEGRKVIFLGDDDAISLFVGLLGLADEICVVDIDKQVLNYLSDKAERLSIKNFSTVHHDLRLNTPEDIMNKFDVVLTDPPYTDSGLRLFLKRANDVLKTSIEIDGNIHRVVGKKCYLSFGNKPLEKTIKIQSSILDHNFIINEMLPDFNHYKGASILGQFSHLYSLQLIRSLKESSYHLESHSIYTAEIKKQDKVPFLPLGFHFIGEMRFENQEILMDNDRILKLLLNSLDNVDLKVIDIFNHDYHPFGYSAIIILETSHVAVHTWPEHGYITFDIFICDEFEKGIEVIKILNKQLSPEKTEFYFVERGKDSEKEYIKLNLYKD
jgi:S-adenosylmethionine decarboxylase proenzyme